MGLLNLVCVLVIIVQMGFWVSGNVVFKVHHKFSCSKKKLTEYKEHDSCRHRRILSAVDLPIGGANSPTSTGLYFTKINIGTPPRYYYVQIDTGSDILWINCAGESDLGIPLPLYDPLNSSSAKVITCGEDFCSATLHPYSDCLIGSRCPYLVMYGGGSSTRGYFVRDMVQLDRVSGNLQTDSMKGRISFGCGSRLLGQGAAEQALDGILGFGQSNSSVISQLASAKKVKKTFSHCLSGYKGGIYAIGEVVEPKVHTTPIMPNDANFNIELMAIDVGGDFIHTPSSLSNTPSKRETMIDSGTTLAYFPDTVYNQLMEKIMAAQPNASFFRTDDDIKCTNYSRNVDDGFPVVTFHFADSLQLKVYPHQYLFRVQNIVWCIGLMSSGMTPHLPKDMTLLGDLVLTDKLVTYNMEDHTIGWTDYNCSSKIKVKDEETGRMYEVGAHDIPSSGRTYISSTGRTCGPVFILMVFIMATKMVMY